LLILVYRLLILSTWLILWEKENPMI